MTFSSTLKTQLAFHRWATELVMEETLALPAELLMKNLKSSFNCIYDTLAHLYQSDRIWLDRLEQRPAGQPADYEAPGCTWELRDAWLPAVDRMIALGGKLEKDEDANQVISYRNLAGQSFSSPVWQIILHVVNHGTYHRGQITTMIRQLGHTPKNMDLIRYYRTLGVAAPAEVK